MGWRVVVCGKRGLCYTSWSLGIERGLPAVSVMLRHGLMVGFGSLRSSRVKRFSVDGEWREMPASVACIGADWFVMPDRVVARCGKRKYQTEAVV